MGIDVSESYQVWFPGESVWELWFVDRRKGARLVDTCEDSLLLRFKKGLRKRILATPAGYQTSYSFLTLARTEEDLLDGARDWIAYEGISCDLKGLGVQPVSGYLPETLARIDVPLDEAGTTEFCHSLCPDLMVPAATLLTLPVDDIVVWKELNRTVLALEKGGSMIHYQELTGIREIDRAREIRELMTRLKSKKVLNQNAAIHLWNRSGIKTCQEMLSINVNAGFRTDPINHQPCLGMQPKSYRESKRAKLKRNRISKRKCLAAAVFLVATLTVLGALFLSRFQTNQHRESILALRPQTQRLENFKSQWEKMAPAVDRKQSVLEMWRNLFSMPSSSEVSIRQMSIGKNKIELTCAAGSSSAALRYIDELGQSNSLGTFSWDYSAPEVLRNGTTVFVVKGFR